MVLLVLLGLITLAVCISQSLSFRRLYRYVIGQLESEDHTYRPYVSVILPCKGLDPGFAENIAKLLAQDYVDELGQKRFEVIFAVATKDDPAHPVLEDICRKSTAVGCRLIVAGVNLERAQKINNQLAALQLVSPDAEALVFVDSDVIARGDFLRYLVAPLKNEGIGVTTGYRFYMASSSNWFSIIRSIWNRMSAWEMAHPDFAFAWGGAMAVRRTTFEKAQVTSCWDRSADDDLVLTTAVRKLGLAVHFVPQCLVASEGDASAGEIIEWTNRQLILTKVYFPELWRRAIGRATVMALWLALTLAAACGTLLNWDGPCYLALLVGLSILPVELLFLLKAHSLWRKVLLDRVGYLRQSLASYCLAIPLAHLVLPWMTLYSVVTNRIQWRGVTYELRSPTETLVVSNF